MNMSISDLTANSPSRDSEERPEDISTSLTVTKKLDYQG
jgi:hypothetical protein